MNWRWWLLGFVLGVALWLMLGRLASGDPPEQPGPIESLIPAICIEREPDGTTHPCDEGGK